MLANRSQAGRRARLLAGAAMVAGLCAPAAGQTGVQADPIVAPGNGSATINQGTLNGLGGRTDTVIVTSSSLIIDWAPTDTAAGGGPIDFLPTNNALTFIGLPGQITDYTVLNRIVPADQSRAIAINGTVESFVNLSGVNQQGGSVWFYTPGGFILGSTARFDVGSLVLTASPIDTSGGLFGAGDTIRFGQASRPGASVVIQPNAQINIANAASNTTGAYLAIVAPQITQGGQVNVDGSVAYVAAEAATVSIDAGLFGITFTTGSEAANPIVHTGTTTGPAPGLVDPDNIVVAAVAKNTAITMLLGGQLGYASGATDENGAIVLSAGNQTVASVAPPTSPGGAAADIQIGTASFNSAVRGFATGEIRISPSASGQTTSFTRSADFIGTTGVAVSVDAGETIDFSTTTGMSLTGRSALTGAGSSARVTVATGGTLNGGTLLVDASGRGSGGTAELNTAGAATLGFVRVEAEGIGDSGAGAQNGTGGTARVAVTGASGSLTATDLQILASGIGGDDTNPGGIGGAGTGGTASLSFSGGTASLPAVLIEAEGRGGEAGQQGGAATGGNAEFALANGAVVTTGSDVTVTARATGGDADTSVGAGGNATGGTVDLSIAGASLTVGGDLLALDASAAGGFGRAGTPSTSRGGTVALDMTAGQVGDPAPSLTALAIEALALGTIVNVSETGEAPGNAGTGVGGRVTGTIELGTLSATSLLLDSSGFGGASPVGGTAGTGFGGRAEFAMADGTVTLNQLNVRGNASGGLGTNGSDMSFAPGSGGAAGVGANPFGADAGAFATISGGTLTVNGRISVEAEADGGFGGNGVSSYGDPLVAGSGGAARGGIAFFQSGEAATIDAFQIDVSAEASGGNGGQIEQFSSGPRNLNGGAGGAATGGIVTANVGGTIGSPSITAIASGIGGRGGATVSPFASPPAAGSTGAGGRGGDGTGGTASLTFTAFADPFFGAYSEASGRGGDGGVGPVGGNGGNGNGGAATLTFDGLDSDRTLSNTASFAFAQGRGGNGGDSSALGAGNGGNGTGGAAQIAVVNGLTASLFGPIADSSAFGGDGGRGGDSLIGAFLNGGNGGDGGTALAGESELFVSLASLTLGLGEGSSLGARSVADGGRGGDGGATSSAGGTGGDAGGGGLALGGVSRLRVEGGTFNIPFYSPQVNARGGDAGAFGSGPAGIGAPAAGGSATGGSIEITTTDVPARDAVATLNLGVGTLTTAGFGGSGGPFGFAGGIFITDTSSLSGGSINFTTLTATAGQTAADRGGISIASQATPIIVAGNATLESGEFIDFALSGSGGLRANGAVSLSAGDVIRIAHSNQTATPTASIFGMDVSLAAGVDLLATGGSLIEGSSVFADAATGNLELAGARATGGVQAYAARNATIGRITTPSLIVSAGSSFAGNTNPDATATFIGPADISGDLLATTTRDIVVAPGAQLVADRRLELISGDDIRIGAGALLRAADNAPPETGYGATDPLQQSSQLRLVAGGITTAPRPAGDIASIVLDGTLEAPGRTAFLSAQAIAGSAASTIASANLYARVANAPAPGAPAANDGGQLPAGCTEGSVCLGRVLATNIVRIGETGFVPTSLRLVGGIDAVDVLLRTAGTLNLGAIGGSSSIRASSSLTIASTGGDIVADGTLAISSGGTLSLAAVRDITATGLTLQAPGTLALFAGRNLTLGGIDAGQLQTIDPNGAVIRASGIEVGGAIRIAGTARVTAGDLILRAGSGIDVDAVAAAGRNVDLASGSGLVRLGSAGGASLGTPLNVTLAGTDIAMGTVTASGAITGTASNGAATLGAVDAGGALTVSATRGGITINGATRGATIALTSTDLTIASGAQLGSATTSAITLTSSSGRAALGGTETTGLWRLTDAEFDRIRSNGDITIAATASGQGNLAFSLINPLASTFLIEGLSFSGNQLGATGTLRLVSGGSIGVLGQANFESMATGQTVLLSAANDIALAAETGGLALRDAAGGLAGTLRLEAEQVHALSNAARTEASGLDLAALSTRLATQDGILRPDGFFQAGGLVARVSRAFFVQNSGANANVQDDRRGLTVGAGGLRIEATGNAPPAVAINGRILGATAATTITGVDVIPATTISGTLDPQSTINGCVIADPASCTVSQPRLPIDIPLNLSRDVITEEVVESAEEAARKGQGSTKLPPVLVEILEVPPRPYDPVIDEPVTGTGNDDLWERMPAPPGG